MLSTLSWMMASIVAEGLEDVVGVLGEGGASAQLGGLLVEVDRVGDELVLGAVVGLHPAM